jgi:aminopeptidase C
MRSRLIYVVLLCFLFVNVYPQKNQTVPADSVNGYRFTTLVDLKATPVKNQAGTGTCWCFATTSFIESELLRMGKGEYDLSEMFVVRLNYINKLSDNYLQQGKGNLGEGSLSHHWMTIFTDHGIVPDEVYTGLNYGSPLHNHDELNAFINAVAAVPVERKQESKEYFTIVNSILDTFLGQIPSSFIYKNKIYTPKSFAAELEINPADYVEITSFTHFPFYSRGQLDIPDNWDHASFYNVPLDEMIQIMDYALLNGYTVNWDGDVSENGFMHSKGIAIIPEISAMNNYPGPEIKYTQKMRQEGFENFTTTDDHLMHITGIAKDQNGTKYYITKNSWGTSRNEFGGYLNMSESYILAKTLFIMVNINSIPPAIRKKLGF